MKRRKENKIKQKEKESNIVKEGAESKFKLVNAVER